jgi:hypothetical protein
MLFLPFTGYLKSTSENFQKIEFFSQLALHLREMN